MSAPGLHHGSLSALWLARLGRLRRSPRLLGAGAAPWVATTAVVVAFTAVAALGGLVVASGNLVLTGLALGAILGVLLLNAPAFAVWVVLIGTLLVSGPLVMHWPQFARLSWLLSTLGFFLFAVAIVQAAGRQAMGRKPMPGFMVIGLVFMVYAIASIALSRGPLDEGVSAFKRQFQYWGLMFAMAAVPFAVPQVRHWIGFVVVLAVLQLPLSIYQRIELMPRRLNMPNEVVPVDIVTGTLEGSMTGGASNNVMVLLLITVMVGLLAARRDRALRPVVFWPLLAVVSAPLVLGETKMALVLLPIALWVVYADLVARRPAAFAAGALLTLALLAALAYFYIGMQANEGRAGLSFRQRLEENVDYNVGRRGYFGGASLNRSNVVPFWWDQHGLRDPAGTVFGHGLGSSHGVRGSERLGHMDRRFPGHAIGLTAASTQLWELGLMGTGLFLAMLGAAFQTAGRLVQQARPGFDRAMCRSLRATVAMLVPVWFAMDLMMMVASLQVILAFSLGLVAWRARLAEGTA